MGEGLDHLNYTELIKPKHIFPTVTIY